MTLTRWKLLAGVFGISVCGFAALAEPACRSVGSANRQEPAAPDAKTKGSVDVKPKATPVVDATPSEAPAAAPAVIPLIAPVEVKPSVGVTTPAEVPATPLPVPIPNANSAPPYTGPLVTPEQFVKELVSAPVPLPTKPMVPPSDPAPIPAPEKVPPAPPQILTPVPTPVPLPPTAEQPPIRQVEASRPATSEKKLKVTLQMDEGNPKFEVRDGEEVVLKVVSDKVDVTSPTQKGDRWSTLKACGQVKFATPGGDGSCDSLQVVPGTGEVVAVGNVKFTYNWGKVETSASSEKMNFRLGTAPVAR